MVNVFLLTKINILIILLTFVMTTEAQVSQGSMFYDINSGRQSKIRLNILTFQIVGVSVSLMLPLRHNV